MTIVHQTKGAASRWTQQARRTKNRRITRCAAGTGNVGAAILLLITNRRYLPEAIQIRSYRVGALVFAAAFFGVLSAITIVDQVGDLV
jgi:hypothetical protein